MPSDQNFHEGPPRVFIPVSHPDRMGGPVGYAERGISDMANINPELLKKVLGALSYREREIIKLRYGLGDGYSYTLEEVGHIFKVTRERIRQIEAKAIRKLAEQLPGEEGECPIETKRIENQETED